MYGSFVCIQPVFFWPFEAYTAVGIEEKTIFYLKVLTVTSEFRHVLQPVIHILDWISFYALLYYSSYIPSVKFTLFFSRKQKVINERMLDWKLFVCVKILNEYHEMAQIQNRTTK